MSLGYFEEVESDFALNDLVAEVAGTANSTPQRVRVGKSRRTPHGSTRLELAEAIWNERLHPRDRIGRWKDSLARFVRAVMNATGVDPFDVDLGKLDAHADEHERDPLSRWHFKSPCWLSRDVDFAVHRVLPAMLKQKYPEVAQRLLETSPRWGRRHGAVVPLTEAEEALLATVLDALLLEEAATRWLPEHHPRWPKGSKNPVTGESIGGQWMEVGQEFMFGGKRWEIAFLGGEGSGRVFAHLSEGPKGVGLREFTVEQTAGQPTIKGASPAEARTFKAGQGLDLTGLTVDPYVDPLTHDPSLPIPKVPGVKLTGEDWATFGRADQENFIRLAQEFGSYDPGHNAELVKQQLKDVDSATRNAVLEAYSSQHGSSTGTRFNFAGLIYGITDKLQLTNAQARREKLKRVLSEVAAIIQWDLYNRTRSPDVTVFHRDSEHPVSWWQAHFIDGEAAIMSGLSQSWRYAPGHLSSWGNVMLVTPLAIRAVCMSSHSLMPAQAWGKSEGYKSEMEVATPDQLLIDTRSVVISENQQLNTSSMKAWLAGLTSKPAGGHVARELRSFILEGKIPPLPPAPAEIQMDGSGGKLWLDPPTDIGKDITVDASGKPFAEPKSVAELGYAKVKAGQPVAEPANQLGLKPGDFIEGMQGSRYVIVDDPGEPSFPFKYAEINKLSGEWMGPGKTYSFESGGVKTFKKLDGFAALPVPVSAEVEGPLWDPEAWANGVAEEFTPKLPVGTIFKVNGHPYEIVGPAPNGLVKIRSLETGKFGTINPDFKAQPMVPKEGYVAVSGKVVPAVGVTFSYQGEKYAITVLLKSGQIQAKRAKGAGVIKLNPDDPALDSQNLHDPALYGFGSELKLGSLAIGERFHGGTGVLTQKPYVVVEGAEDPKKVRVRNLDTGEVSEILKTRKYRRLVPVAPKEHPGGEPNPDGHVPKNWRVVSGGTVTLGAQTLGAKFVFQNEAGQPIPEFHAEVMAEPGSAGGMMAVKLHTGPQAGTVWPVPSDQPVYLLEPLGDLPGPVTAYDPSAYMKGPVVAIQDMPEGTVFFGGKGGLTPYMLKKKGPKSGAVATNLLTGKPYPAIPYTKSFQTAKKKKGGLVPYSDLVEGDLTPLVNLHAGDQFKGGGGNLFQVVSKADGDEVGVTAAEVTPWGLAGTHEIGAGALLVTFHAKAGQGYDPNLVEPPFPLNGDASDAMVDLALDSLDAVASGGFSPYKSGSGSGGKYKHHKLKEMGSGTAFIDSKGKPWLVKQAGATPIISDGKANYTVDGNLRGRMEALSAHQLKILSALKLLDESPPIGFDHTDMEAAQAEFHLTENASGVTLGEMSVGDWFAYGGHKYKISENQAQGVTGADWTATVDKEGDVGTWAKSFVPTEISLLKTKQPSDPSSFPTPDEFVQAQFDVGNNTQALQLEDLDVGDFFVDATDTLQKIISKGEDTGLIVGVDASGAGSNFSPFWSPAKIKKKGPHAPVAKLLLGPDKEPVHAGGAVGMYAPGQTVFGAEWSDPYEVLTHVSPHVLKVKTLGSSGTEAFEIDVSTLAPPWNEDAYIPAMGMSPLGSLEDGGLAYYEGTPFRKVPDSYSGTPGWVPLVNLDTGKLEVVPMEYTAVKMIPKAVSGSSASLAKAEDLPALGMPVMPSQMVAGMKIRVPASQHTFFVNSVTPVDGGKFRVEMTDEKDLHGDVPDPETGEPLPGNLAPGAGTATSEWSDAQIKSMKVHWLVAAHPPENLADALQPAPIPESYPEGDTPTHSLGELDVGDTFKFPDGQSAFRVFDIHFKTDHMGTLTPDYFTLTTGDGNAHQVEDLTQDVVLLTKGGTEVPVKLPAKAKAKKLDQMIQTAAGTFQVGEIVSVWAGSWKEPKAAVVASIEDSSVVNVVYAGDTHSSAAKADWLQKQAAPAAHVKDFAVGGKVTWKTPGGKMHSGTVKAWDPKTKNLTVTRKGGTIEGGSVTYSIPDSDLIDYQPPPSKPAAKKPGDFVLGSDLKAGDYVQTTGTSVLLKVASAKKAKAGGTTLDFEIIANPPGGHEVGDHLKGTWTDDAIHEGGLKGDPSPWKLASALLPYDGPPLPEGADLLGHLEATTLFKQAVDGPAFRVLHVAEENGVPEVYYQDIESGKQLHSSGTEVVYPIEVLPGQSHAEAVAQWGNAQMKKADFDALVDSIDIELIQPLPAEVEVGVAKVLAKYGGVDAIPPHTLAGYGSEWGSGGQYRYRSLDWLPDGEMFHLKGGGKWQKLTTLAEGVVIVNFDTGDALRVLEPGKLRVKPPQGRTWKVDALS